MNFLSFSRLFGLLTAIHGVLDSNFKLYAFIVNGLIKGKIEKPGDQCLGLMYGESLTWQSLNSNPEYVQLFYLLSLVYLENHV
jgi:hypothetical protein